MSFIDQEPDSNSNNPYESLSGVATLQAQEFSAAERLDKLSPFVTAWFQPRRTIRTILLINPGYCVLTLAALSGVGQLLDQASIGGSGDRLSIPEIFAGAFIAGPIVGIVSLWIFGFCVRMTGIWLGGKGESPELRAALAWSCLPKIASLIFYFPEIAFFGNDLFTSETPTLDAQPILYLPFSILLIFELVLAVWGMVLMSKMLAEVQCFRSAWKGLANAFLALMVIMVPLIVVSIAALLLRSS